MVPSTHTKSYTGSFLKGLNNNQTQEGINFALKKSWGLRSFPLGNAPKPNCLHGRENRKLKLTEKNLVCNFSLFSSWTQNLVWGFLGGRQLYPSCSSKMNQLFWMMNLAPKTWRGETGISSDAIFAQLIVKEQWHLCGKCRIGCCDLLEQNSPLSWKFPLSN